MHEKDKLFLFIRFFPCVYSTASDAKVDIQTDACIALKTEIHHRIQSLVRYREDHVLDFRQAPDLSYSAFA